MYLKSPGVDSASQAQMDPRAQTLIGFRSLSTHQLNSILGQGSSLMAVMWFPTNLDLQTQSSWPLLCCNSQNKSLSLDYPGVSCLTLGSIIKAREIRYSDWLQLSYVADFIVEGRIKTIQTPRTESEDEVSFRRKSGATTRRGNYLLGRMNKKCPPQLSRCSVSSGPFLWALFSCKPVMPRFLLVH